MMYTSGYKTGRTHVLGMLHTERKSQSVYRIRKGKEGKRGTAGGS